MSTSKVLVKKRFIDRNVVRDLTWTECEKRNNRNMMPEKRTKNTRTEKVRKKKVSEHKNGRIEINIEYNIKEKRKR